jgi:hypothetical protein
VRGFSSCFLVTLSFGVGCGGASAQTPLDLPMGTTRAELVHQLRSHEYCEGREPAAEAALTETFPRCSAPGAEYAQSWVVAYYDEGGRVVKVQRWEKYAEPDRALDRFNELVEKRTQAAGTPSVEAKQIIGRQEPLPMGTTTWVAFPSGEYAAVGVYLLDPSPPENANVLEEIVEIQPPR